LARNADTAIAQWEFLSVRHSQNSFILMEAFISQQPAYDKQLPRNCNARRALNSQHRESFPISNTFMMIWYTDNQWLSGQLPHFLLNLEK